MLQLKNIGFKIADSSLFENVSWTINPGKRIALIGPNGAGKTTLLRLISREIPLQSGEIVQPKDFLIGYLPQEELSFGRDSVLKESLAGNAKLSRLESEILDLQMRLQHDDLTPDDAKHLSDKLGAAEAQFSVLGGYEIEAKAKKILTGLGFKESEMLDSISTKSGGWRMRIYLTRLLLMNPDLLLLDEPTNHLDIESLEWLENYLVEFRGSMIIVSHDRFFIDRLSYEIAELEDKSLTVYPGTYDAYKEKKALNFEQMQKKSEEIKAERERLTIFINRFRYKNTKAAQVQDRIKRLEKLEHIKLPKSKPNISFHILSPEKSFKDVCSLRNVSFRYGNNWIFQNINLDLFRGEKAALVGANGEGKTTLTRILFKELQPQTGDVLIGEKVKIGYYAQHQIDALNLNNTIYEEVESIAADLYRTRIRDILGVFRFSGDDIEKKIAVLSGGEKARVSLAKILISPVNFLLMDEPTNHLDLNSKEALEQSLIRYDGTLLLISHDRYFLDKIVSIVYELKNGCLTRFEGNYSDYLRKKASTDFSDPSDSDKLESNLKKDKERKRFEAEARQKVTEKRRTLRKEIETLEKEIDELEQEKSTLESLLAESETYKDQEKSVQNVKRYQYIQTKIPNLLIKWETLQSHYEDLLSAIKKN